jgi:hypothetical protein
MLGRVEVEIRPNSALVKHHLTSHVTPPEPGTTCHSLKHARHIVELYPPPRCPIGRQSQVPTRSSIWCDQLPPRRRLHRHHQILSCGRLIHPPPSRRRLHRQVATGSQAAKAGPCCRRRIASSSLPSSFSLRVFVTSTVALRQISKRGDALPSLGTLKTMGVHIYRLGVGPPPHIRPNLPNT